MTINLKTDLVNNQAWQDLKDELAQWQAAGKIATLWWRDDDAAEPCKKLSRLDQLGRQYKVPLSLAIIPGKASMELREWLASCPSTTAGLVHGLNHLNHAAQGEKKAEFTNSRPLAEMVSDLWEAIDRIFDYCQPVLVPPWNRIPDELVSHLPDLGFKGLSTYKARITSGAPEGLIVNNCHVDLINWRHKGAFPGEAETLKLLTDHLFARRTGSADQAEITGLLTHHLVQDAKSWDFLRKFFAWTAEQPTVRWLDAREVFKLP